MHDERTAFANDAPPSSAPDPEKRRVSGTMPCPAHAPVSLRSVRVMQRDSFVEIVSVDLSDDPRADTG